MNKKIIAIGFLAVLAFAAACGGATRLSEVVGQVWLDEDNDGIKSEEEPWIADVIVTLFKTTDGTTVEIGRKVTDAEGAYKFSVDQSEDAELEVRVTVSNGAKFTIQMETGESEIGSDVNANGSSGAFPTRDEDETKVVNAGFATVPEEVASTTLTEPEIRPPTETPAETPAPTDTVAPSPTPTIMPTDTPEVIVPDPILYAQTLPDELNDGVDCERTLNPTSQDLPFDIIEAGWSAEEGEVTFIIEFDGDLQLPLSDVGEQDFLGLGWGLFDPQAEIYSNPDPTWLPNVSSNISFDVFYDPAESAFIGTLFTVEEGVWVENEDLEYPVINAGSFISMTVPAVHIPPNAGGYATAVYFDAEEGQLYCDVAGLDELTFQDILIELRDSFESMDPFKFTDTFEFDFSDLSPVGDLPPLSSDPAIEGAYNVTNIVTSGQIHEIPVGLESSMILSVTLGMIPTQTIQIQGPGAWVAVGGPLSEDGSFDASGTGEVAGFSDIDVNLVGTIISDTLIAQYTMGDGRLPGGEDIVFNVSGVRIEDLPLEPALDYSEVVGNFFVDFNDAFQNQDVDFLYQNLHPEVINLYGAENCQTYLSSVIENTLTVNVLEIKGPALWDWERDDLLIPIEEAFTVQVAVSVSDQTQEQDMHVAVFDNDILWFTDCGEPLR